MKNHLARFFLISLFVISCSNSKTTTDAQVAIWPDSWYVKHDGQQIKEGGGAAEAGRDASANPQNDLPTAGSWQIVKSSGATLHDMACVGGHVFIVGDQKTIWHFAPGSLTAQNQASAGGDVVDFYTVSFADTSLGVIGGNYSEIWETKNLGTSWDLAPQCRAFNFGSFRALSLASATAGYAAGQKDSGEAGYKYYMGTSWVCGSTVYAAEIFNDVVRVDNEGWIVGQTGGKIYHTDGDVNTWYTVSAGTSKTLRAIAITPNKTGIAVGDEGTIVRSSDGAGKVWAAVTSTAAQGKNLYRVFFLNDSRGWAVGDEGMILHTIDGGQTWSASAAPTAKRLEAVCFHSATEGWVAGQDGLILHTTTGGLP